MYNWHAGVRQAVYGLPANFFQYLHIGVVPRGHVPGILSGDSARLCHPASRTEELRSITTAAAPG